MLPTEAPEIVRMVWHTLGSTDAVGALILGGSRAKGSATELSDWDLYLEGEPAKLMAEVPGLMAPLRPLGAFWEPLSEEAGYMMVMDGPVKIDLFPIGGRRSLQPPWEPVRANLSGIDGHYWDWMLWLGSKALRHQDELVSDELAKMQWFLLGPLGVERTPADLHDAVALYLKARAVASEQLKTSVPEGLGRQVLAALRQHRLV
ncbi:MAG: nucleotidyltransferase domain-containing protein [Solirubrobacterales bacterium]|nr:nucleotidyltransferase domain-containing protein [Solirubrobacterales bacterium]